MIPMIYINHGFAGISNACNIVLNIELHIGNNSPGWEVNIQIEW